MQMHLIIIAYSSFSNICHVYLFLHFLRHIYALVSPKINVRGSDYWLEHFLDGKQILLELVIDYENNEFPMGSMVIKGECLTLATQKRACMYIGIIV